MATRPNELYRGRRRGVRIVAIVLTVLLILIIAAFWAFHYLQRFIVYRPDGLSLEIPLLMGSQSDPIGNAPGDAQNPSSQQAEIVFDTPVYDDVAQTDVSGLTSIQACYVPRADVTDAGLALAADRVAALSGNALVIEMKAADGTLAWASRVPVAVSYGASAAYDPTQSLAALKERGIYLVAEVCCLPDKLMASRNLPLALLDADGAAYTDSTGTWLDPYNPEVRDYLVELCLELQELGFDEVLLSGLACPEDGSFTYSQSMSTQPDAAAFVSSLAVYLTDALADTNLRISAVCPTDALQSGTTGTGGQDPVLFFKVFDRVYALCTDGSADACRTAVASLSPAGDLSARFVPITTYGLGDGSWVSTATGQDN